MKIKKDMMVKVVAGNFKGLSGKVLKVIPETQRAIVEGVALTKRTLRPSQDNPKGGFTERERSLHVSNLMALESDKGSEFFKASRIKQTRMIVKLKVSSRSIK